MRAGFDAKRAAANNTGLGNYSRSLIEALSTRFPDNEYLLYVPKPKENPRLKEIRSRENIRFVYPQTAFGKLFGSYWRSRGMIRDLQRDRIDVFHGLSNEIPVGIQKTGIKTAVSIHDLIFLRYPHLYRPIDRKIYRSKFLYACRNSDVIIAVSECTKRDIVSFFNIPEEKIKVVYQSCRESFSKTYSGERKSEIKEKYRLPDKFLLNVGSMEERKNLLLIVKALKEIDPDIHLVAAGKSTPYVHDVMKYVNDNNLQHRVHLLHEVSFSDLPVLYHSARLFIYPSFFEGFGIPVIEALNSGIPVIAATGSCLEEAGGPGSAYVDPNDEKELARMINVILYDPDLQHKMIAGGKQYTERFLPDRIADDVMNVYSSLFD